MPFVFGSEDSLPPGTDIRRVPGGVQSKEYLLGALDAELDLPEYFGQNWDALLDCLRDLSWISPGPLALVHEDLPLKKDLGDLTTYLEILADASEKWEKEGSRSLAVVFPSEVKADVQPVLDQYSEATRRSAEVIRAIERDSAPPTHIRVIALHRLPFDREAYAHDVRSAGADSLEVDGRQAAAYRDNWGNAWLVVVEFDLQGGDPDLDGFSYGPSPRDPYNQAPWLETALDSSQTGRARVGFFLHHIRPERHLWYGQRRLQLPAVTPAPPDLLAQMPYESPD